MSDDKIERIYAAIDLKSFYASVECVERGLDPLTTNLVVADPNRTEKTICLAVSPSLKKFSIPGRARLFEVISRVKEVNASRRTLINNQDFEGASYNADELIANPKLELSYIVAPPRMAKYMEYSTRVYNIYLKYISSEDIHVYSIDECFLDLTNYLDLYNMSAHELVMMMVKEVLDKTGVTATAGIGTNMYLCKIAMDISAKRMPADKDGVRIAELNEQSYKETLWDYKPITDFWRVGCGIAKKLASMGIYTMGDIALCSVYNEECLYNAFGINAELLIDHAWGVEPVTIDMIRQYKPKANSISSGQVLKEPYECDKARIIVQEMADLLALDLVDKGVVTDQIVITIGYDVLSLTDEKIRKKYKGEVTIDHYGRYVPKHAHGTINLGKDSSSTQLIIKKTLELYDRIINPILLIRRVNICANNIKREDMAKKSYEQMSLFDNIYNDIDDNQENEEQEKNLQKAILDIKRKYGKNAILKGTNFRKGATTIERNGQVGGHKA